MYPGVKAYGDAICGGKVKALLRNSRAGKKDDSLIVFLCLVSRRKPVCRNASRRDRVRHCAAVHAFGLPRAVYGTASLLLWSLAGPRDRRKAIGLFGLGNEAEFLQRRRCRRLKGLATIHSNRSLASKSRENPAKAGSLRGCKPIASPALSANSNGL